MSKRDVQLLLKDIFEAATNILSFTSELDFDGFLEDKKTIHAVVRNFEVIGEAANRIPEDFKNNYPQIEWRRLVGLRNRSFMNTLVLITKNIWKIKKENVPQLMERIEMLIKDLS